MDYFQYSSISKDWDVLKAYHYDFKTKIMANLPNNPRSFHVRQVLQGYEYGMGIWEEKSRFSILQEPCDATPRLLTTSARSSHQKISTLMTGRKRFEYCQLQLQFVRFQY